jgi:hypothetical protein
MGEQGIGMSPVSSAVKGMSFPEAIKQVIIGRKIHKVEWENKEIYGLMDDAKLKICLADGKLHEWIISEGDLTGNDYIVL